MCSKLILIESERAMRTHCCTLIEIFVYIYIYIVTKILRKIRATTFTEKLRIIMREGERLGRATPLPISLGSATLYPFATH